MKNILNITCAHNVSWGLLKNVASCEILGDCTCTYSAAIFPNFTLNFCQIYFSFYHSDEKKITHKEICNICMEMLHFIKLSSWLKTKKADSMCTQTARIRKIYAAFVNESSSLVWRFTTAKFVILQKFEKLYEIHIYIYSYSYLLCFFTYISLKGSNTSCVCH
jgi:hypothetical protein